MGIEDHLPQEMKENVRRCLSNIQDISLPVKGLDYRVCKYWQTPEAYANRANTSEFICPLLGRPIKTKDDKIYFICRRSTDMTNYTEGNGNGNGHKKE